MWPSVVNCLTSSPGLKFLTYKMPAISYPEPSVSLLYKLCHSHFIFLLTSIHYWTSLVVHRIRICLPMQGTRIPSLVREDLRCLGAIKPVHHNYWAHVLQPLKALCLESMCYNKGSQRNEKPAQCNQRVAPLCVTRASLCTATKTQGNQKKKKSIHYFSLIQVRGVLDNPNIARNPAALAMVRRSV